MYLSYATLNFIYDIGSKIICNIKCIIPISWTYIRGSNPIIYFLKLFYQL